MLTDAKLRTLKPTGKLYKVADRDGMYVAVSPTGAISFRYNYRVNGRQETLTLGRYGVMTLGEAREELTKAKKMIAAGNSPAKEKARSVSRERDKHTFGAWAEDWLKKYKMAESTRDMRRSIYNRDIKDRFGKMKLEEITHEDLRKATDEILEKRNAPATAVQVREVVMLVFRYAIERGQRVENPADMVKPSSIATFSPRDRALTPEEIGIMYEYLDKTATGPQFKVAAKLLLLTMVRKGELSKAKWTEISFDDAIWTIPAARMKRRNPHLVFLSSQALDIFTALKMFAGGSEYILPNRYDGETHMSDATLNRVLDLVWKTAKADGRPIEKFGPHDLRRTASTLLHEAGYNTDWIEKCLAHEQKGVRAVYNKAEYREQRTAMLQDWANMIDGWTSKRS